MSDELPYIIGFTGFKGTGKTTVAEHLPFVDVSFADRVREVAHTSFGLTYKQMTDSNEKDKPLPEWDGIEVQKAKDAGIEVYYGVENLLKLNKERNIDE